MANVVDARGLSGPQPVILAQKAILAGEFPIEVLVDTEAARDSVERLGRKIAYYTNVEQVDDEFKVTISK